MTNTDRPKPTPATGARWPLTVWLCPDDTTDQPSRRDGQQCPGSAHRADQMHRGIADHLGQVSLVIATPPTPGATATDTGTRARRARVACPACLSDVLVNSAFQARSFLPAAFRLLRPGGHLALNAGADAVQVAKWINEAEQKRQRVESEFRAVPTDQTISPDVVAELLRRAGDLADAVVRARPDDKADLYTKLGLTMTYYPEKKLVEARVAPASTCADGLCPRGDLNPHAP
ncbi:hypothetical protein ABT299_49085 [Spirillospora sp. NPDC000708]